MVALVLAAGGVTACSSASSHRTGGRPLQLGGRPVNPAPGGGLRLARPGRRPLRVLFVGDSLTRGEFAVRRRDAYPALVTAALRAGGPVTAHVKARPGVTASYWATRPLPMADLVIVELGTNDFSARLTPVATFTRDYARLIASIRARSPHAQLLCLSLWRSSHYGYEGESLLTYNKVVAAGCQGGAFVWISALYDAKGARLPAGRATFLGRSDSFHPTNVGHREIADAIEHALRLR